MPNRIAEGRGRLELESGRGRLELESGSAVVVGVVVVVSGGLSVVVVVSGLGLRRLFGNNNSHVFAKNVDFRARAACFRAARHLAAQAGLILIPTCDSLCIFLDDEFYRDYPTWPRIFSGKRQESSTSLYSRHATLSVKGHATLSVEDRAHKKAEDC